MKANKYSDLKIFQFPDKIASFRGGYLTAPIYVRIKPINRCSHSCHWCCYSDGTKRKNDNPDQHLQAGMHETMDERAIMPWTKLQELLQDLHDMGTKAITFSGGGEPLMYPHIVEAMKLATELNLDLSVITNGQHLSKARAEALYKAKWVRVSIDYTSAEQMVASRHVPEKFYQEILDNLKSFAAGKPATCDLGVNFICTRENHDNLVPFARTLKDCGVENVRFSPVYLTNFLEYHAPIAARVTEQLIECQALCDDSFSVNTTYDLTSPSKSPVRPFTKCLYAQTVPVVGADLGVYGCHNVAYSNHGRIGSIANQSFRDMWFSDETSEWFKNFNPSCVCNHECANHSKVKLFNELSNMSTDNFV